MHGEAIASTRGRLQREFLLEQAPLIVGLIVLGCVVAYFQYGFIPGADQAFPIAGVRVPIWHLVWLGVWTGYTMALAGQAAGIFALPYTMSVLQFTNPHVAPTIQLLTLLNPLGALLGFRETGQWNLDFALPVCLGGILGGILGPFVLVLFLTDVKPFQFTVGIMLAIVGIHLLYSAYEDRCRAARDLKGESSDSTKSISWGTSIKTVCKSRSKITISFGTQSWTFSTWTLFVIGLFVGVISAAVGVGGGFLLVPIFAAVYGLPMYVLVAATIPYSIVLSAVVLFTFGAIVPWVTGTLIQPEWSWGLFVAAGGIFGSWVAAKTQKFVPDALLKILLGVGTAIVGVLYIANFFFSLPIKL